MAGGVWMERRGEAVMCRNARLLEEVWKEMIQRLVWSINNPWPPGPSAEKDFAWEVLSVVQRGWPEEERQ